MRVKRERERERERDCTSSKRMIAEGHAPISISEHTRSVAHTKVALTSGNIVARARDATAFVADQIGV